MRCNTNSALTLLATAAAGAATAYFFDPASGARRRESLRKSITSATSSATDTLSTAAASTAASVVSLANSVAHLPHQLTHRPTTLQKLYNTLPNILHREDSHQHTWFGDLKEKLWRHRARSVDWSDVEDAIYDRQPRRSFLLPALVTGLAVAGTLYYFKRPKPRRTSRQRYTPSPIERLRQLNRKLQSVAGPNSAVSAILREERVVLQGTATPEEYDQIIIEATRLCPGLVNEVQAVSPV